MSRSLRREILLAISIPAAIATLGLGVFAFMFAYSAEDRVFDLLLEGERSYLAAQEPFGRETPSPQLPFVRYYAADELPPHLREAAAGFPTKREAQDGNGHHFHLTRYQPTGESAEIWLVAAVDPYLAVRRGYSKIFSFTAAAGLALLACSLGLGLWLVVRATAPLERLRRETAELRPNECPATLKENYPDNEIGALANALQAAFERVAAFVDREQRFTRDVSHELRTPLSTITNACELLAAENPAHSAPLHRIEQAARNMQETVEALLALAREDDASKNLQNVTLLPIVERLVVEHAHLVEGKAIDVRVLVAPDWQIRCPEPVLRILVANLLTNAFQYTSSGQIEIANRGDRLLVCDSGEGIPEALRENVLNERIRGSNSVGLGIGLSIVDRLCKRFGWKLAIESGSGGTIASVEFPQAATRGVSSPGP